MRRVVNQPDVPYSERLASKEVRGDQERTQPRHPKLCIAACALIHLMEYIEGTRQTLVQQLIN